MTKTARLEIIPHNIKQQNSFIYFNLYYTNFRASALFLKVFATRHSLKWKSELNDAWVICRRDLLNGAAEYRFL